MNVRKINNKHDREQFDSVLLVRSINNKLLPFFDNELEKIKDDDKMYNEYKKMFEDLLTYIECLRYDKKIATNNLRETKKCHEVSKLREVDKRVKEEVLGIRAEYDRRFVEIGNLRRELSIAKSTIEEQEKKIKKWQGMYTGKCEVIEQLIKKYEIV